MFSTSWAKARDKAALLDLTAIAKRGLSPVGFSSSFNCLVSDEGESTYQKRYVVPTKGLAVHACSFLKYLNRLQTIISGEEFNGVSERRGIVASVCVRALGP